MPMKKGYSLQVFRLEYWDKEEKEWKYGEMSTYLFKVRRMARELAEHFEYRILQLDCEVTDFRCVPLEDPLEKES